MTQNIEIYRKFVQSIKKYNHNKIIILLISAVINFLLEYTHVYMLPAKYKIRHFIECLGISYLSLIHI